MAIRIDGGIVVGWSGTHHELIYDGTVLIDGNRISYAGPKRSLPADRVIDAGRQLICPGFINLHIHSQLNIGDYLLTDVSRKDYYTANYFVFGAPAKGKKGPLTPADAAIECEYALFSALKNGSTTILDTGGPLTDWEAYVEIVGRTGGRVFFGPRFRSSDLFTDEKGRFDYRERPDKGRSAFEAALAFIEKYHGRHNGRMQGFLNPAQAETCQPELLRDTLAAAKDLNVGIHIHAGGNFREFFRILDTYRRTIVEYLADCGLLRPRTVLGHMVFIDRHSLVNYPGSNDLKLMGEAQVSIGHCAHKYAKMAMAMESFDRYLDRGINVGLGTDTYPLDIIAEMRYASLISRLVDRNAAGARAAAVFNAATIGGARALGKKDLGRLEAGALADIVIVDLRNTRYGPVRDPITALVEYASGADVKTVIVDGDIVINDGVSQRVDEDDLYLKAEEVDRKAWDHWAEKDWAKRTTEEIVPPAFPTRT